MISIESVFCGMMELLLTSILLTIIEVEMKVKNMKYKIIVHPGDVLKDILLSSKISQLSLAQYIKVAPA